MQSQLMMNRKHIKIIIVGYTGVGKTSLVDYFINRRTINYNPITIGVDFSTKSVEKNGKSYKIHLFDTAGLEKFQSITKSYYTGAMCAIVCFSLENMRSFNKLNSFFKDVYDLCDKNAYIVLVGTHSDSNNKEVTIDMINKYVALNNVPYFEVSSATGNNIDNLFNHIINKTIDIYPYATIDNNIGDNSDYKDNNKNFYKNSYNNIISINNKTNDSNCCNLI